MSHPVVPTNNTAQSKAVNPNSLLVWLLIA
jgi:hypothetical protein